MLIFVIVLVMDVGEGLNYTRSKIMCNACLLVFIKGCRSLEKKDLK